MSIPFYVEIEAGYSVNASGTTSGGGRIAALGTNNGSDRPAQLILLRADMTHYVDNVAGSHEIGFGVYAAPWNTYPSTTVYAINNGWNWEDHTILDANGNPTEDVTQAVGTRWFARGRTGDAEWTRLVSSRPSTPRTATSVCTFRIPGSRRNA